MEVTILKLALDQILLSIFYIVLAILEFLSITYIVTLSDIGILPRIFPFLMKERSLKVTKIAHSNYNYYVWDLLIPQREEQKTDFISVLNPRLGQIIYEVAYSEKVTKV